MKIMNKKQKVFITKANKVLLLFRKFLTAVRVKPPRSANGKRKLIPWKSTASLVYFPLVFVYYELLLRLLNGSKFFSHLLLPVFFGIACGFLVTCLSSCFREKVNRIMTIVLTLVFAVLFGMECMIKSTFQVYMTLSTILAGTNHVVGGYSNLLISVIFHGLLTVILYLVPIGLYITFGKKYVRPYQYRPHILAPLVICFLVFFLLGGLFSRVGSAKLLYTEQYNFDSATQTFGLMTALRLDRKNSKKTESFVIDDVPAETPEETQPMTDENGEVVVPPATEETGTAVYGPNMMGIDISQNPTDRETLNNMNLYVFSQSASNKNAYTGLFAGKNLIMICAEAFSDKVIDPVLTPTLYRLTHNGFYFSDYYQPAWGGSTITGEASFTLGIVPEFGVQTILDTATQNNYFTMGNQLQRLGYYSAAMHNGEYDYYDRQLSHMNLGYSTWLGQGNGLEKITGDWPGDEEFFSSTIDYLVNVQPFSVYYMTLSGHCTYKPTSKFVTKYLGYVQAATGNKYKDVTNYYLCYQMELEAALTTLVAKLEAAGIADNTVICLTSDHYPYGLSQSSTWGNTEDYLADLYGYSYNFPWERDHSSLIIWSGCLEHDNANMAKEISAPTYSLDILPTLSNLFGVEFDSRFLVGRDVFAEETEPLCIWSNYSWCTTKGWYDSGSSTFYPKPGETVDDDYVSRHNVIVKNKLAYSKMVITEDYFTYMFGPDTVPGAPALVVPE